MRQRALPAMTPALDPVLDKAPPRGLESRDSLGATMLEAGSGGKEAAWFGFMATRRASDPAGFGA